MSNRVDKCYVKVNHDPDWEWRLVSQVAIIGAGIGGLAAAALLAQRGCRVVVLDKEPRAGGKARRLDVAGSEIEAGPTVLTMLDVFEDIFRTCGTELSDHLTVHPASVIARHAWDKGEQLDLFADPARSEQAVGDFAGAAAAAGYRNFRAESARIHRILEKSFLRAGKVHWPGALMQRIGLWRMGDLLAIRPYESLWSVLGEHFADQRLRQLYARYATYCGSSPFSTPATLMLIAHVEAQGVWLVEGGISTLAEALQALAESHGATFRFGEEVASIEVESGKATAVQLASGERIAADAVVANADPAAIAAGRLCASVTGAVSRMKPASRSLSALVWLGRARTASFPLLRHNVFFSPDYPREFADIAAGHSPADPSVYVCAQDRDAAEGDTASGEGERLQIIVNAPADGDTHSWSTEEKDRCTKAMRQTLSRCGLELAEPFEPMLLTPTDFERLSPSTGGAIYGRASHGWAASFLRQGTRTRIPGLYCAGGSTHPGSGVPMAALSGMLATQVVLKDLALTRTYHRGATLGGMSMRSARTGGTG